MGGPALEVDRVLLDPGTRRPAETSVQLSQARLCANVKGMVRVLEIHVRYRYAVAHLELNQRPDCPLHEVQRHKRLVEHVGADHHVRVGLAQRPEKRAVLRGSDCNDGFGVSPYVTLYSPTLLEEFSYG